MHGMQKTDPQDNLSGKRESEQMSIISMAVCFVLVFLFGCIIGLVLTCLVAESGDGKYYDLDELCILDDIIEGDDD